MRRSIHPNKPRLCFSPRRKIAASAGDKVNALKAEMAMAKAMVSENCLYKNAGGAREKRNRHEYGYKHQRSCDDRARDLGHSDRSSGMRIGMVVIDMALHIFDDHDGIIDHQTGGQRDAEHGQRIDGKVEDLDEGEGTDQGDREW